MEREIEALICWYKQQKSDFVSVTYLDKSTLIKKYLSHIQIGIRLKL